MGSLYHTHTSVYHFLPQSPQSWVSDNQDPSTSTSTSWLTLDPPCVAPQGAFPLLGVYSKPLFNGIISNDILSNRSPHSSTKIKTFLADTAAFTLEHRLF